MPVTFGFTAAGWLSGLDASAEHIRAQRFAAQLGGASGTLASLGEHGTAVLAAFSRRLELDEPTLPWHTERSRIGEVAGVLGELCGVVGGISRTITLLAQTEVGEVSEAEGGRSSSMAHKRNPAAAVLARACARLVHANASPLVGGEHELQRAAGDWQAEWPALSAALAFAGGAAAAVRRSLEGLEVHADRMAANAAGLDGDAGSAEAVVDQALAFYRAQE